MAQAFFAGSGFVLVFFMKNRTPVVPMCRKVAYSTGILARELNAQQCTVADLFAGNVHDETQTHNPLSIGRGNERRRARGGGANAAWALRMQALEDANEHRDFRRQNVFLREQRAGTLRCPAEMRWAGQPPDVARRSYEHVPTLRMEKRKNGQSFPVPL